MLNIFDKYKELISLSKYDEDWKYIDISRIKLSNFFQNKKKINLDDIKFKKFCLEKKNKL